MNTLHHLHNSTYTDYNCAFLKIFRKVQASPLLTVGQTLKLLNITKSKARTVYNVCI